MVYHTGSGFAVYRKIRGWHKSILGFLGFSPDHWAYAQTLAVSGFQRHEIDTRSKQHGPQTSNSGRLNIIDFFGYNKFFLIV